MKICGKKMINLKHKRKKKFFVQILVFIIFDTAHADARSRVKYNYIYLSIRHRLTRRGSGIRITISAETLG